MWSGLGRVGGRGTVRPEPEGERGRHRRMRRRQPVAAALGRSPSRDYRVCAVGGGLITGLRWQKDIKKHGWSGHAHTVAMGELLGPQDALLQVCTDLAGKIAARLPAERRSTENRKRERQGG